MPKEGVHILGDEAALANAEQRRGMALLHVGRTAEALDAMEQLIPRAEAMDAPVILCTALLIASMVRERSGDFERCRRYVARVLDLTERRGARVWLPQVMGTYGRLVFCTGDWPLAGRYLERAVVLGSETGSPRAVEYPLLELGRLRLAEGAREDARRHLDESIALATSCEDADVLRAAQCVRAEYDVLEGRPAEARGRLLPLLDGADLAEWGVNWMAPVLAWAHLEVGDLTAANALARQSAARARAVDDRLTLADILRVQALRYGKRSGT